MAELTKQEITDAVMQGLREGGITELIDARATAVFYREFPTSISEKLEKTFGINCIDAESREDTRKDMEWLRNRRAYAESDKGISEQDALRALANTVTIGALHLSRTIMLAVAIGFVALISLGASQTGWVKALLK
jgi:hypothetical protein